LPPTHWAEHTHAQMWLELCDIITKHPKEVQDMKVEAILRGGIRKFTDEVGVGARASTAKGSGA